MPLEYLSANALVSVACTKQREVHGAAWNYIGILRVGPEGS